MRNSMVQKDYQIGHVYRRKRIRQIEETSRSEGCVSRDIKSLEDGSLT